VDNVVRFTINKYNIQDISDNQLAKIEMWVTKSGDNKHNLPITEDAIRQSADTLVGKPILYKYNKYTKDFMGHEVDEIPCGVVLSKDDIRFEYDENEELWLVCTAYIWKYYCPEVLEVFKNHDGEKPISMEIQIVESQQKDDKTEILSFVFLGVTLIGDSPAIPNAKATVLKFSEMVEEVKKILFAVPKEDMGKNDPIKIDLSKKSADMTTPWGSVDKIQLRDSILKAKNYKTLVNKCYLVVEDGWEDSPSLKLKYPVCRIKDNILVLCKSGCESAFSFLESNANADYYRSAKAKLKKYHKILGLDTSNFSCKDGEDMKFNKEEFAQTFGITANEMWNILQSACNDVKYKNGDMECSKYWMRDYDEDYIYAMDEELNKTVAIPYSIEDGVAKLDLENVKPARLVYVIVEDDADEKDDLMDFVNKKIAEKEQEFATEKEQLNSEITTYKEKIAELEEISEKFSTLEKDFEALKEENTKLLEFKTNVEEQERKSKIEFAINSVADDLTQEQIDEWREKAKEFSNPDDFSNAIKAFAYSVAKSKNKGDVGSIRVPIHTDIVDDNTNKSLWDRL
jgi:hypothetical protein